MPRNALGMFMVAYKWQNFPLYLNYIIIFSEDTESHLAQLVYLHI